MLPLIANIGAVINFGIGQAELTDFCRKNGKSISSNELQDVFELAFDKHDPFNSIEERRMVSGIVGRQVPKMLLIGIVSSFEHHSSLLMREILRAFPRMISESDKQVSVKDVFASKNIDEFKEFLLDKEIELITRDSIEEQITWFEKKLSLGRKIQDDYGDWESLMEIFERRNLFAHGNGIVNERYLKRMTEISGAEKPKLHKGAELFAHLSTSKLRWRIFVSSV